MGKGVISFVSIFDIAVMDDALLSGIWTRKSFLHSFGLVICAGMNGYYTLQHARVCTRWP